MSVPERAGQLLWAGLDTNASMTSLDNMVRSQHLGGVVLLGGWSGSGRVAAATKHLQSLTGRGTTAGMGLLVSADQEGGQVQQLRGDGFTRMPSAHIQDTLKPTQLTVAATLWAREMAAAGVNVNLAPVADTVPASLGAGNGPIGQYGREFSSDPVDNARMVAGFVRGMHAGGVAATVKHFPGLGRIRNNTDFSATGITDSTTTSTDPYLGPFAAGIGAGADIVMVGSAIYAKIDPGVNAVFSHRIVTGILRDRLSYAGVVVTDDVGSAKAVSRTPVAQRATKFVAAGGDVVLTANPALVPTMAAALVAKAKGDPAFNALVTAAATRVVALKAERGLAPMCR